MLAWAKVVKTWNKSLGTVVGYYVRMGRWGVPERITPGQLPTIEEIHYTRQHLYRYQTAEHHFSAIIQYQYGLQMHELVQDVRNDETLPYAPNEELLVYINPQNPSDVKLGDNMNQLWLPFTIFAVGLTLSIGILIWGFQHGWVLQ